YLRPLYDALYDMLDPEKVDRYLEKSVIEIAPIAFMRGRTLNDSFVILDEAQNTTSEQMKMFVTRLGFNSKAVITGDVTQIDLPNARRSGLLEAADVLKHVDGLTFVYFDEGDVVRHHLVQRIIRAYDEFKTRVAEEQAVLLTSNSELRALNSRFRGKDRPTDVLSFPPLFGVGNAFAGDVAISAEMAAHNARLLGHSPAEEIKILALHGMLHLAGYDHERDHGEMAHTEERLRKALHLPVGLIDRSRQPEVAGAGRKARSPVTTMQRKSARKRVAPPLSS